MKLSPREKDKLLVSLAAIVAEDERETGRRAVLNFGHTVGHAIETVAGTGSLRRAYSNGG